MPGVRSDCGWYAHCVVNFYEVKLSASSHLEKQISDHRTKELTISSTLLHYDNDFLLC